MSIPISDTQALEKPVSGINVRHVQALAPLHWLKLGIDDFRKIPALSLIYGTAFAALCAATFTLSLNVPWYALGLLTGLVVVGPFFAAGLYAASRDLTAGREPSIAASLQLLFRRKTYLALFSLMLALIMAAWVRFSALLFAVKFSTLTPSVETYTRLLTSSDGWVALAYFGIVGFVLAAVVFAVSAIAIPLILDKDENFIVAMQTSFRAVTRNPVAMTVWASLIVTMTAVGLATAFVGLALLFPVLGYATWHSYQGLTGAPR